MESVQIIGSLILSAIAIVASTIAAIVPPIRNHKKTKQYDKQWKVLAELYRLIADADIDISVYLSPLQSKDTSETEKTAVNSFNKMARYFCENKIYLPTDIASLIDSYIKDVHDNLVLNNFSREKKNVDAEKWYETWKKHQQGSIKESKDKIENMFREHLKIEKRRKRKSRRIKKNQTQRKQK